MIYRSTCLPFFPFEKSILFFYLSFIFQVTIFSQTMIKGTVTDLDTNDPLIGANILQKGTANGSQTDVDGSFKITMLDDSTQILIVSYTGYDKQEVTIENEKNIDLKIVASYTPGCGGNILKFPKTEGAVKKIQLDQWRSNGTVYGSQLLQKPSRRHERLPPRRQSQRRFLDALTGHFLFPNAEHPIDRCGRAAPVLPLFARPK